MNENDTRLVMAVNQLTGQIRRANYLGHFSPYNANTKRPTMYQEFGYPEEITFQDYYNIYSRNAAAFAGVHRLLDGCWQDIPDIVDGDDEKKMKESTPWEKSTNKFMKRLWPAIKETDRRNMIGHYSAVLIQLRDSGKWEEEINKATVKSVGDKALVRLIPVWEPQLTVAEWEEDINSEEYGLPKMYNFNQQPVGGMAFQGPVKPTKIHPSRVVIFSEGSVDGDPLAGIPLLKAGFNKLLDLEKISGGGAEGFLKNASRQMVAEFDDKASMEAIEALAVKAGYKNLGDAMGAKFDKMNRGTDSAAVMQGGKISVLSVAPGDPQPTWTVTANEYASSLLIPFTMMFGQQTGRLASDEDKSDWAIRRNQRRGTFLSEQITELLNRFWAIGLMEPPKNGEVTISWADLLAPSEKDKIENMGKMADVAVKTQQAFGQSSIEPNEVRDVGELEPLPDAENIRDRPTEAEAGNPLNGDENSKDAGNSGKQKGSDAEQSGRQQDAA